MGRFVCLLVGLCLFASLGGGVVAHADVGELTSPAWSAPSVKALRKINSVNSAQSEPNFLSNIDCSLMEYRQVGVSGMQTGCFTATAFGLLDSDNDTAIFNGTDEGLPLLPYASHEILAPWPQAADLIVLDPANTGGSYIYLYKNPLVALHDQHNLLAQLTAKQLHQPPDLNLRDPSGNKLVINPQTMAFSDGGAWLVVETLNGSFVRINLATLDTVAFAPSFGASGSPALFESRVAVSDDGRYVAIASQADNSFRVYDLTACGNEVPNLRPRNCQSYNYSSFIHQQIGGLQAVRHVRFVNDGLLSFEARSSNPASSGVYELAPEGSIDSLIDYLALGDSYTSGEGAFDYLSGTDTVNDMCHLSGKSYPLLLTHDLFSNIGGHSVACSGAVINDVGSQSKSYKGQVRDVPSFEQLQNNQPALLSSIMTNYVAGYVAQQRFVSQYQPRITTVSVGGDDIGFGDIIQNCVMPHVSIHLSDSTCYSTYEDRLELLKLVDRTVPRWIALYKQLVAQAPSTQLYAIGYPKVVYDKGSCALNAHLGKSELEFAEELVDYLNASIEQAATKAGINYIDISQALAGHRLCETSSYNVAVNGLTAGKDGGLLGIKVFGKESYHPNALGQSLIEQAILRQSHNLTKPVPTVNSAEAAKTALLSAPKTGRPITTKVAVGNMVSSVITRKQTNSIKVSGSTVGLRPNTTYTVRIDGSNGSVIGSVASNELGDIDSAVVIPEGTVSGSHTIDVTGSNQTDETVDITQPIYIPASAEDTDGDGIDDASDSCPSAVNSGQDDDQDGIDDSCDGFIGQSPSSTSSTPGTTINNIEPPVNVLATSGNNLVAKPVSVAASFKTTGSASSNLGANTTNPVSVKPNNFKPAQNTKPLSRHVVPNHLPIVNILAWTGLLVIAWWLLLVLGLMISHVIDDRQRSEYA